MLLKVAEVNGVEAGAKKVPAEPVLSVSQVVTYYTRLQRWFDEATKDDEFRIDLSYYINNPSLLSNTVKKAAASMDRLYFEGIQTVVVVIRHMLNGHNIGIMGLPQSGKTAAQQIAALVGSLIHFTKTGQRMVPLFFLPNHTNCVGQFRSKFVPLYRNIEHLRVTVGGNTSASLATYCEDMASDRTDLLKSHINKTMGDDGVGKSERDRILKHLLPEIGVMTHVVLSMSLRQQRIVRYLVSSVKNDGWKVLVVRDEAHYAIANGSVNDKIFSARQRKRQRRLERRRAKQEAKEFEASIYELLDDPATGSFIAVSATNYASLHLKLVNLMMPSNYCGLDMAYEDENGNWVRIGGKNLKLPVFHSMTTLAKMVGSPDLAFVNSGWFKTESSFLLARLREDHPFDDHTDYRCRCIKAIADAIEYMLLQNTTRKHRGMLVRFVVNNEVMDEVVEALRLSLPSKIKLVKMYDDSFPTVADLLEFNGISPTDLYVILPTARARMSDSFTAECGYGLDFTNRYNTVTALYQGLIGRLSGPAKTPIIVLSDTNYDYVQELIENDFRPIEGMKLHSCVKIDNQKAARFFYREEHSGIAEICDRIERKLFPTCKKGTYVKTDGRTRRRLIKTKASRKINFWNDCLTPSGFSLCQKIAKVIRKVQLLGLKETDCAGRRYASAAYGPPFTLRTEGIGFHPNRGGKQPGDHQIVIRIAEDKTPGKRKPFKVIGFDLLVRKIPVSSDNYIVNDNVISRIPQRG